MQFKKFGMDLECSPFVDCWWRAGFWSTGVCCLQKKLQVHHSADTPLTLYRIKCNLIQPGSEESGRRIFYDWLTGTAWVHGCTLVSWASSHNQFSVYYTKPYASPVIAGWLSRNAKQVLSEFMLQGQWKDCITNLNCGVKQLPNNCVIQTMQVPTSFTIVV